MLVLTLKPKEKIILGDGEIEIAIVSISGNRVRVGLTAPKTVPINRNVLYKKLKESDQHIESILKGSIQNGNSTKSSPETKEIQKNKDWKEWYERYKKINKNQNTSER